MCSYISVHSPSSSSVTLCVFPLSLSVSLSAALSALSLAHQLRVIDSTKPELWKMSHILVILPYLSQHAAKQTLNRANWTITTILVTLLPPLLPIMSPLLSLPLPPSLHLDCTGFLISAVVQCGQAIKTLRWKQIWLKPGNGCERLILAKYQLHWYVSSNRHQFERLSKC